jgi:type IX secretion system PorP/SprF family membrane protein
MKNISYIYTLVLLLFIMLGMNQQGNAQQIPLFSQYQFNQYLYNPAVAGSEASIDARLIQRYQWRGITDAPRTFNLNAYGPLADQTMGVGGMVYSDIAGPTRRTGFQGSYAYHIQLNDEMRLGFGLGLGIDQYVIDGTQVKLDNTDDPALQNYRGSSYEFNSKFGIYFYADKYYAGFSIPQLIPDQINIFESATNMARLEEHYILNGGYKFDLGEDFQIEPALLMRWKSPTPVQFDISVWAYYKEMLWLGVTYRTEDAISFGLGFKYNDMLMIGYAYDYTTSFLSSYSSGSHEIMLGFKFKSSNDKENPPML